MNWRGMGSGPGPVDSSQAEVHVDFSCRHGLPVRPFDRTVSADVALSNFSTVWGAVSASGVVNHTDPVHAPAAPSATAAAIWRPVTIPPAARTGTSRTERTAS